MYRLYRMTYLLFLFVPSIAWCAVPNPTRPVVTNFAYRPQSLNSARKVAGEVPGTNLVHLESDCYYGYAGAAPEYTQSFHPTVIAQALFGSWLRPQAITPGCPNGCDLALLIQGTAVPNRNQYALRAEDFYLGEDFNSKMTFSPMISNFLIDLQWYVGLDEHYKGGYLRVYAPFVHTHWNLHSKEIITHKGTTLIAGSFSGNVIPEENLLQSAGAYFIGHTPGPLEFFANPDTQTPLVRDPLTVSKFRSKTCNIPTNCNSDKYPKTQNAFAEVRAELGWNFMQHEYSHCGVNFQVAAPTGTQKVAEWLFQPLVGNGAHWEIGAGLTAHKIFWTSCWDEYHAGIYLDATVTHLCPTTQQRTFDLKNGPLSRYSVAVFHGPAEFGTLQGSTTNTTPPVNPTNAQYQVTGQYSPVANLTTHKVRVSVKAQADISLWLNYSSSCCSWDLGYNFYGRSCEEITCHKCPPRLATEPTWALKGDAHAYGFIPRDEDLNPDAAYALSISESTSTLNNPTTNNNQNANIDHAQYAFMIQNQNPAAPLMSQPDIEAQVNTSITRTSIQPIFLTTQDINYKAQGRIATNKLFTHFSYQFEGYCWSPFIGFGGEIEWGPGEQNLCKPDKCSNKDVVPGCGETKTCCLNIGVSQWGLWFKTGMAFN